MASLKIFEKDSIKKVKKMDDLKTAQKFVNRLPFYPALKFVYSTINKEGIENTINIQKR